MAIEIDATRRVFLRGLAGSVLTVSVLRVTPLAAQETVDVPESVRPILGDAFGGWDLQPGRISLELPVIAETGLSVPVTFSVDSPMTEADHVQRIMGFVPGNPEPIMADYLIGPRAGIAEVQTRIRVARTQTILAAALMSDGSRFGTTFQITVTRGACIDDIFLPDLQAIEERNRLRGL